MKLKILSLATFLIVVLTGILILPERAQELFVRIIILLFESYFP